MNPSGPLLVDTSFWVALARRKDQYHPIAKAWQEWLGHKKLLLVTTEMVLWELLNSLSEPHLRGTAAAIRRHCLADPHVQVITTNLMPIEQAVELYELHQDKTWSLTDCFSFAVMQAMKLSAALTSDRHFIQAGYDSLLLQQPPE